MTVKDEKSNAKSVSACITKVSTTMMMFLLWKIDEKQFVNDIRSAVAGLTFKLKRKVANTTVGGYTLLHKVLSIDFSLLVYEADQDKEVCRMMRYKQVELRQMRVLLELYQLFGPCIHPNSSTDNGCGFNNWGLNMAALCQYWPYTGRSLLNFVCLLWPTTSRDACVNEDRLQVELSARETKARRDKAMFTSWLPFMRRGIDVDGNVVVALDVKNMQHVLYNQSGPQPQPQPGPQPEPQAGPGPEPACDDGPLLCDDFGPLLPKTVTERIWALRDVPVDKPGAVQMQTLREYVHGEYRTSMDRVIRVAQKLVAERAARLNKT